MSPKHKQNDLGLIENVCLIETMSHYIPNHVKVSAPNRKPKIAHKNLHHFLHVQLDALLCSLYIPMQEAAVEETRDIRPSTERMRKPRPVHVGFQVS